MRKLFLFTLIKFGLILILGSTLVSCKSTTKNEKIEFTSVSIDTLSKTNLISDKNKSRTNINFYTEKNKNDSASVFSVHEGYIIDNSQDFYIISDTTINDTLRRVDCCLKNFDTNSSNSWYIIGEHSENVVPDFPIKLLEIYYWDTDSNSFKNESKFNNKIIAISKYRQYAKKNISTFIVDPSKSGKYKLNGKSGKI